MYTKGYSLMLSIIFKCSRNKNRFFLMQNLIYLLKFLSYLRTFWMAKCYRDCILEGFFLFLFYVIVKDFKYIHIFRCFFKRNNLNKRGVRLKEMKINTSVD